MNFKKVNALLAVIVVLLIMGQVAVFICLGIQNGPTSQAQSQQEKLEGENKQLQVKINQLTAYSNLETRAKEAGFDFPTTGASLKNGIVYLTQEAPIALKD